MNKRIIYFLILHFSILLANCGDFQYQYQTNDKFSLTIRGNYRFYLNNRYIGLQSKEIKSSFIVTDQLKSYLFEGKVYYLSKMIRENRNIGFEIINMENCSFSLDSTGHYKQLSQHFYPIFRWIPFFPDEQFEINKVYEISGQAVIDLYENKSQEIMPVHFMLVYKGKRQYYQTEFDYFEIICRFDSYHQSQLISVMKGFHNFKLFYDSANGRPVFMTDQFEEYLVNDRGNIEEKKGFYSFFFTDIVKMNKKKQITEIQAQLQNDELYNDIQITEKEEGISLTIKNLLFQPNSTQLLAGEDAKIRKIADILRKIENRTFMIIGHTALSGTESEQLKLSRERAAKIAELIIAAGIPEKRLIYTGKGAQEPIAPNDTPENMQKNRRVEIFILED